jgi:hypothetical protein
MKKARLLNLFEIMERAVGVCGSQIHFPDISSAEEKEIYSWMEVVESECAAKQCLDVLNNAEPFMSDVITDMPDPEHINYIGWIEAKNFYNICMKVREIKSHMMMTSFRRCLSGVPRTYAGIQTDSTPHQIWENLRTSLQRTITKSSDYAAMQWKGVHIKLHDSLSGYLDDFIQKLSNYEATRKKLGQSDINEEDLVWWSRRLRLLLTSDHLDTQV